MAQALEPPSRLVVTPTAGAAIGVAYQCASPVEYPFEEDPEEPAPFSLTDVNRELAKLGR